MKKKRHQEPKKKNGLGKRMQNNRIPRPVRRPIPRDEADTKIKSLIYLSIGTEGT